MTTGSLFAIGGAILGMLFIAYHVDENALAIKALQSKTIHFLDIDRTATPMTDQEIKDMIEMGDRQAEERGK